MYYILLDEPFDPSALDPGNTYPKLFISWLTVDMLNEAIRIGLEFGDTDGSGNAIRGEYSQTMVQVLDGEDWTDFCSQTTSGIIQPMIEKFDEYLLDKLVTNNIVDGVVTHEEFQL